MISGANGSSGESQLMWVFVTECHPDNPKGGGLRKVNSANNQTKESSAATCGGTYITVTLAAWLNMHVTVTHTDNRPTMINRRNALRGTGTSGNLNFLNNPVQSSPDDKVYAFPRPAHIWDSLVRRLNVRCVVDGKKY